MLGVGIVPFGAAKRSLRQSVSYGLDLRKAITECAIEKHREASARSIEL